MADLSWRGIRTAEPPILRIPRVLADPMLLGHEKVQLNVFLRSKSAEILLSLS